MEAAGVAAYRRRRDELAALNDHQRSAASRAYQLRRAKQRQGASRSGGVPAREAAARARARAAVAKVAAARPAPEPFEVPRTANPREAARAYAHATERRGARGEAAQPAAALPLTLDENGDALIAWRAGELPDDPE